MRPISVLEALIVMTAPAAAQMADPGGPTRFPALGHYADASSRICGSRKVDVHPATIPEIGRFATGAGMSLDGVIDGRRLAIRLAEDGNETYVVDGEEIRTTGSGGTNDPRVRLGGAGYMFCRDASGADCPATIAVMVRQAGRFATFDVSRQIRPHAYVTNEENWKAEIER